MSKSISTINSAILSTSESGPSPMVWDSKGFIGNKSNNANKSENMRLVIVCRDFNDCPSWQNNLFNFVWLIAQTLI